MEQFYMITLAIAILLLILILTIIGVMLSYRNAANFPPSQINCPDYWTETVDSTGKAVCKIDNRNVGILRSDTSKTYGYNPSTQTIDFRNASWGNNGMRSNRCSLKHWANLNKISWDGVSNYNKCK